MKRLPSFIPLAGLVAFCFTSGLQSANRVFVKAEANDEFLIERARDGSKKVQTYQFMKGQYHSGNYLDPSMGKVTFEELAYDLAVQLRKQEFYPEPEMTKSDLLIVVHYGSTGVLLHDVRYEGLDTFSHQIFDEQGNPRRRGLEGLHNSQLYHIRDNSYRAKLLGMDFNKTWSSDKRLLSILSSEPRYFVILYAYDFPLLRQGEVKQLWSTRYSIRTIGQSFEVAIKDMNRIASDFVGMNMKGFTQKRIDDKAYVSFGEIEVIDIEEIKEDDQSIDFLNYDLPDIPSEVRQPRFSN